MKRLFFILLIYLCSPSFLLYAEKFYISPTGDDNLGDGSIGRPWRSLAKACEVAVLRGDTIFVKPGVYDESRTSKLSAGVSIQGEGENSVITSTTLTAEWTPIIEMISTIHTDGDQTISFLKFDGGMKAAQALWIERRNNVEIHDCIFIDFYYVGVYWIGDGGYCGADPYLNAYPPKNYIYGSKFYDNKISNCAGYDDHGRGALYLGGHDGMLIFNNNIIQKDREFGFNGYPIKFQGNGGWIKDIRIFDNFIEKSPDNWGFAIEGFFIEGIEIYSNHIIGTIDLNFIEKGNNYFGALIHDNLIGPDSAKGINCIGILLEFGIEDIFILRNRIRNCAVGIYHTMRYPKAWVKNEKIGYNIFENIGAGNTSNYHSAIRFGEDANDYLIFNLDVYNNVFQGDNSNRPYFGIHLRGFEAANNIKIQNNIFMNFKWSWLESNRGDYINSLIVTNNLLYNNSNSNSPTLNGKPSNFLYHKNIVKKPKLIYFYPQANSPAVNAGIMIRNIWFDFDSILISNPPNIGCFETIKEVKGLESYKLSILVIVTGCLLGSLLYLIIKLYLKK